MIGMIACRKLNFIIFYMKKHEIHVETSTLFFIIVVIQLANIKSNHWNKE